MEIHPWRCLTRSNSAMNFYVTGCRDGSQGLFLSKKGLKSMLHAHGGCMVACTARGGGELILYVVKVLGYYGLARESVSV